MADFLVCPSHWKEVMDGNAFISASVRGVSGLDAKIGHLITNEGDSFTFTEDAKDTCPICNPKEV